ncbi:MAG TPA: glycosyltransferase family 4 protein [Tepidisphaeraceae bacterium]|nr:glycosyltransferase family 4 protein [Tepidisphaeraceae bacterium]
MHIAYLINQYPQTSQSFIRREIAALEAQGFTVDRYTIRTWDQQVVDPGDIAEKAKARVVLGVGALGLLLALLRTALTRPLRFLKALRLAFKLGKRGERGRLYHLIYLAEACVLLPWLTKSGAAHVHAHFGTNSTTVALLTRSLGGPPYSFTCHGPEEFDRPAALKLGDKIAHAAFAVAVSEFGRSQLFRWCGHEHWHKIHVIRCGVDASYLDPALAAARPPVPDVPRLACVGRLAEQKGQLLLVQAAGLLAKRGVHCDLLLVGDGPMRPEIERLIKASSLQDRVTITGWASNQQVRDHLLGARAMVLPSFAEGLPVVVMEALALGRPVVSTFVAGIPELVAPGACGYLVPAGSVELLADAMAEVLRAGVDELREMGREGVRRVRAAHDVSTEAARLADLFRRLSQLEHPEVQASSPPPPDAAQSLETQAHGTMSAEIAATHTN